MKKVKIHYSTKEKVYYSKTKYHTQTMLLSELPTNKFWHEALKVIDIDEVLKLAKEWVNQKNPDTFNKVINVQIV